MRTFSICILFLFLFYIPITTNASADSSITTKHSITLFGKKVLYEATLGSLPVRDNDTVIAEVFYIYYRRTNGEASAQRPIMFLYGGGPGGASMSTLIGGVASPVIANRDKDGYAIHPVGYHNNDYSILDECDLVYVDPVKTGYSKTIGNIADNDPRLFSSIGDMEYLSDWVRGFLHKHNRWLSPIFLLGGSYGTTRVAGMAGDLYTKHGIQVNGVILRASNGLQMPRWNLSPESPQASAIKLLLFTRSSYRKQLLDKTLLKKPLNDVLKEAKDFVFSDLLPSLTRIGKLTEKERLRLAQQYIKYSGVSISTILKSSFDSELIIRDANMFKPDSLSILEHLRDEFRIDHISGTGGNFPIICATAWYHKLLPKEYLSKPIEKYVKEIVEFTINELIPAYCKNSVDTVYNASIIRKASSVSGLHFSTKIKDNPCESIRRLMDGNIQELVPDFEEDLSYDDVRFNKVFGSVAYNRITAANAYLRTEFGYKSDEMYQFLATKKETWKFSHFIGSALPAATKLYNAMQANPFLKVIFLAGYYDGNCDYISNELQSCWIDRSGKMKDRIFLKGYASGHAIDRSLNECRAMNMDIRAFIKNAIPKHGTSAR